MGWIAITKEGEVLTEDKDGRPVQSGEEGKLAIIAQEDYGHRVAIDLYNGIIAIDYETLGIQNGSIELHNPKMFLWIVDDSVIVGELKHLETVGPDKNGWYSQNEYPIIWRPIWFTRHISGIEPVKVLGAQTTMPEQFGGRNVKKMISFYPDGRLGIN